MLSNYFFEVNVTIATATRKSVAYKIEIIIWIMNLISILKSLKPRIY